VIHCREHLINWLIKATEDDVLLYNAFRESGTRVGLLGTFDPLPGSKEPGWLVRVTTCRGRMDLIAIVKDYLGRPDRWYNAPEPDWDAWLGPSDDVLIGGDDNDRLGPNKNKGRFDRIMRCSALHSQEDKGAGDRKASPKMVRKRSNPPNVPASSEPVIKTDVHNKKTN